jgi:hypothetical protein
MSFSIGVMQRSDGRISLERVRVVASSMGVYAESPVRSEQTDDGNQDLLSWQVCAQVKRQCVSLSCTPYH